MIQKGKSGNAMGVDSNILNVARAALKKDKTSNGESHLKEELSSKDIAIIGDVIDSFSLVSSRELKSAKMSEVNINTWF